MVKNFSYGVVSRIKYHNKCICDNAKKFLIECVEDEAKYYKCDLIKKMKKNKE